MKRDIHELIPKHITKEDIIASINYNIHLEYGIGNDDDIDHLGNRRIRAVGELLPEPVPHRSFQNGAYGPRAYDHAGSGTISRLSSLINIKPVTAAVKEFFGSSQLSQFMDQNNPLAS